MLQDKINKKYFTASDFKFGLECEKKLYLKKKYKAYPDNKSAFGKEKLIYEDIEFATEFQKLFPRGVNTIKSSSFIHEDRIIKKVISKTKELINKKVDIIYNAVFEYSNFIAHFDVIVKQNEDYVFYSLSRTAKIDSTLHILTLFYKLYIVKSIGVNINSNNIFVAYINKKYTRGDVLDLNLFFKIDSLTDLEITISNPTYLRGVTKAQISTFLNNKSSEKPSLFNEFIKKKLQHFHKNLNLNSIPMIEIGPHCTYGSGCSFKNYCWKHVPEKGGSLNIVRAKWSDKSKWLNQGILYASDVPQGELSQRQLRATSRKMFLDKVAIKKYLNDLSEKVYHFDLETIAYTTPRYKETRAYQQIPFSYSIHMETTEGLTHYSFLSDITGDQREKLVASLIEHLKDDGDILVYNMPFERTRLLEMIDAFPKYNIQLKSIINRMKDLMTPFKEQWYTTPKMEGSYSLKKVLPALGIDLYSGLNISNGLEAQNLMCLLSQPEFLKNKSEKYIQDKKLDMIEYNKMDTLAQVYILNTLKEVVTQ